MIEESDIERYRFLTPALLAMVSRYSEARLVNYE